MLCRQCFGALTWSWHRVKSKHWGRRSVKAVVASAWSTTCSGTPTGGWHFGQSAFIPSWGTFNLLKGQHEEPQHEEQWHRARCSGVIEDTDKVQVVVSDLPMEGAKKLSPLNSGLIQFRGGVQEGTLAEVRFVFALAAKLLHDSVAGAAHCARARARRLRPGDVARHAVDAERRGGARRQRRRRRLRRRPAAARATRARASVLESGTRRPGDGTQVAHSSPVVSLCVVSHAVCDRSLSRCISERNAAGDFKKGKMGSADHPIRSQARRRKQESHPAGWRPQGRRQRLATGRQPQEEEARAGKSLSTDTSQFDP